MKFFGCGIFGHQNPVYCSQNALAAALSWVVFLFVIYLEPWLKRILKFENNMHSRLIFSKFEQYDKFWLS